MNNYKNVRFFVCTFSNTGIYTYADGQSLHGSAEMKALKGKRKSGGKIVFCSNCGNKLSEGARFCSFCGARVTEMFEVPAAPEKPVESVQPAGEPKAAAEKPYEAALKKRVTFDWSNVIDEPQKKVVPDIKSPWATTGNIDEKELYAEMNAPSGRSRTMSFIDVLKAEKEEQAKKAPAPETDVRPIQYTEVLDPGYLSGETASAEPEEVAPVLHFAPLYEDIDEPVVTPFDIPEEEEEPVPSAEVQIEVPEADPQETPEEPAEVFVPSGEVAIETEPAAEAVEETVAAAEVGIPADEPAVAEEPEAPAPEEIPEPTGKGFGGWFELPDFLKPKEEKVEAVAEVTEAEPEVPAEEPAAVEEPEAAEIAIEEPAMVEEPETPAAELQIAEEPVFEEAVFEETEEPAPAVEPVAAEEPTVYEELVMTPEEPAYFDELVMTPEEPAEIEVITPVVEEPAPVVDEPILVVEEPAPVVEEPAPVVEEPAVVVEEPEEAPEEVIYEAEVYSNTEDEYLNLNTERSVEPVRGTSPEDDYEDEDEGEEPVDEEELFTEMEETAPKHTGMTIAAPADKESEIEALKKRLAELMGTSWEEPAAPAEETPAEEPVVGVEEAVEEAPVALEEFEEAAEEVAAEPEEAVEEVAAEPEAVETIEIFEETIEPEAAEPAAAIEDEYLADLFEAEVSVPAEEPVEAAEEAEPEIDLSGLVFDEDPAVGVIEVAAEHAAEPEPEVEEPEPVTFEPALVLEEEEAEIEEPILVFEEPAAEAAEPEEEEPAVPEISIEDAYLDIPEASTVSETRVRAAAEPELEIEEPEAVTLEPALVLEEEEAEIEEPEAEAVEEPVLVFEEPEVAVSEPEPVVIEEPVLADEEPETVAEKAEPEVIVEEPEKPKTIDDFLAAILREGADEAPAVAAAEPVIESMFAEPAVPADDDIGVVLTAEDLVIAEPETVTPQPEAVVEEPAVVKEVAEPAADASGLDIGLADLIVADEPVEDVAPVAEPVEELVEAVEEPVEEIFEIPLEPEVPAEEPAPKETDALSLEDLEKDLFGSAVPEGEVEATKKIDKFYTLYRKNEEFQRLLDEEYNKLKAAGGPAPEPAIPDEEPVSNKKIEDATIYQDFDLEKEAEKLREEQAKAEAAAAEAANAAKDESSAAIGAAPVAAAVGAAAAGAAIASTKDEKEDLEYEEYEKGGGFLTVLAVIIAILLIVLLGIILVLNFMPESAIAFKIDSIIENITSHFTAVDVMGRQFLL